MLNNIGTRWLTQIMSEATLKVDIVHAAWCRRCRQQRQRLNDFNVYVGIIEMMFGSIHEHPGQVLGGTMLRQRMQRDLIQLA